MKHLKPIITTLLLLSIQIQLSAQETSKTKISIEVDPATFAFGGYSLHLRIQPKNCEHLLIGFGTYAMELPDLLINFNPKNKNKGWDVKINQGYSFFGEYHFKEVNHKWFIGSQIGIQEFKIQNSNVIGTEKFTNLLTMAYLGYTIKPFNNNLYIKPWAGIGYTSKISGKNTISNYEYDISPITMFATLHVGYTF